MGSEQVGPRSAARAERARLGRRRLLQAAGAVTAGAALAPSLWSAAVSTAQEDVEVNVANLALTLEYLQLALLEEGLARDLLADRDLEIAEEIRSHHKSVIGLLDRIVREEFGAQPIERPPFTFPEEVFADRSSFLWQACEFAELGVKAYHGQITQLPTEALLGYAAAVAGTKSRQAAILAVLCGQDPLPAPVEGTVTIEEALAAAQPFRGEGSA